MLQDPSADKMHNPSPPQPCQKTRPGFQTLGSRLFRCLEHARGLILQTLLGLGLGRAAAGLALGL
eukprot:8028393-Alexandrium_andersonii.AAC.1